MSSQSTAVAERKPQGLNIMNILNIMIFQIMPSCATLLSLSNIISILLFSFANCASIQPGQGIIYTVPTMETVMIVMVIVITHTFMKVMRRILMIVMTMPAYDMIDQDMI